jgi:D-beta-D-heptose 7-phosphate kinase/D-beta-D-heptose 1-phosphate adenosyltransferase
MIEPSPDELRSNPGSSLTCPARCGSPDGKIVLISDYAKGTCSPALLGRVIDRARQKDIPVFIDPARVSDYSRYQRADLITPNRVEAEMATGMKIRTPEEGLAAARQLSRYLESPRVMVKLDRDGIILAGMDQPDRHYPTRPRAVQDVTGAGDMVLAMAGLCRASGLSWNETIQFANVAAGLEVEKLGVAPVNRQEIRNEFFQENSVLTSKIVTLAQLIEFVAGYRRGGKRIAFTNGCFDLLHIGHVSYLQEASGLADVLVVAINSDESVRRLKGRHRPVIRQSDRAKMLAALDSVDHVVIFEEDTPHQILLTLRPDLLVKGGTYTPDEVVGHEVVRKYGGEVRVVGLVTGVSTSKIIHELLSTHSN